MSSRQEEKERRKQERMEREKAEAAAAQRKRLVRIVAGVVVAAAVLVGAVVATTGGTDDAGETDRAAVPIPDRKITDLADAAKAAGCVLSNPPIEGSTHVTTKVKYKTNPPTSGDHVPPDQVASDGDYSDGVAPEPERYVHSLEHGRVIIQYKPGLPERRVDQLRTLFGETSKTDFGLTSVDGGFTLLMANNTTMRADVAATAWGHMLACDEFNDKVFDAIRAFRQRYILQGPEKITEPQ